MSVALRTRTAAAVVTVALAGGAGCVPDAEPPTTSFLVVTSPADTVDGVCDAQCTIRDAIAAANADGTIDEIRVPAGTYAVASTTPTGADGEAYRVTDDLLIVGAGPGATTLDVGGRDVRAVWRTTASLELRGLAVHDVGSGTTTVARTVVAAPMAAAGETVALDDVAVDGVQPDMSDAGGNGAAAIVTAGGATSTTAHPFAIDVRRSTIERIGRGIPFVNLGGDLVVVDSTYDAAPAILVGPEGPAANVVLPHQVLIATSTVTNGTANLFSSCVHGVAVVYLPGALVDIAGSALGGGTAGSCGGVATSGSGSSIAGAVVGMSGYVTQPPPPTGVASVRRSTIDGAGQSNAIGILALGDGPIADIDVDDSTLLSGELAAVRVTVLNLGPGPAPQGGGVDLRHTTLVGPPAGPGYGITIAGSVPVRISNTVGLSGGAFLCGPGTPVTSGGGNTFSDPSCALGGPGDQISTDPLLGPLGTHGGVGRTLVPLPGSPLIDTAVASTSTGDQRDVVRPQGAGNDRGAVERRAGD